MRSKATVVVVEFPDGSSRAVSLAESVKVVCLFVCSKPEVREIESVPVLDDQALFESVCDLVADVMPDLSPESRQSLLTQLHTSLSVKS